MAKFISSLSNVGVAQESSEARSEAYIKYDERVLELLTQRYATSSSRVRSSDPDQARALRGLE